MFKFAFGRVSKAWLSMLHGDATRALTWALAHVFTNDVAIIETIRFPDRQRFLKRTGKSHTLQSRHLPVYCLDAKLPTTKNHRGRMVSMAWDLTPYKRTRSGRWVPTDEIEYFYAIAEGMRITAVKFDLPIKWGGFWKDLRKVKSIKTEMDEYIKRCEAKGKDPFLDLGHYELDRAQYEVKVPSNKDMMAYKATIPNNVRTLVNRYEHG